MQKHDPNSPEALQRMMTLLDEIENQTDRGAAIIAAAWVEESITGALESFLNKNPKPWERLFSGSGPLGTFSAKIDLCHLLGLTSDVIWADLHRLRRIRNEFAHLVVHKTEHTALNFSSQNIKSLCAELKCVEHEKISDPRTAFVRACATLYADFDLIDLFRLKITKGSELYTISARIERM